jgi:hypothetical protein
MVSGYTLAKDNSIIATLAPITSPGFSGVPTAPTAAQGTNSSQLATTAFVASALSGFSGGNGGGTTTIPGDIPRDRADVGNADWNTLQLPGIYRVTGTITNGPGGNPYPYGLIVVSRTTDTVINQTYYTHNLYVYTRTKYNAADWTDWKLFAFTDSPNFTGVPTAPTVTDNGANDIRIATTAFVANRFANNPAFGGIPTAPTAAFGTNTTQLATTAFVQNAIVAVRATKLIADGSYTLGAGDDGYVIEMGSANANTVTIPSNASMPFSIGVVVEVFMAGTGATTIVGASGVTLRTPTGGSTIQGQWGTATLRKRGTNEWVVAGLVGA